MQSRQQFTATLRRDFAYLLPGPVFALASFTTLITLFSLSLGTFIIWVGAALLLITLRVATRFADISRHRAREWGLELPEHEVPPRESGFGGLLREIRRPGAWHDLVFELLVALPLRFTTGLLALCWPLIAVGGLTYWVWSWSLPEGGGSLAELFHLAFPSAQLAPWLDGNLFDIIVNLLLGAVALVTMPAGLHGLAWLDARVTKLVLGRVEWFWLLGSIAGVALLAATWPVLAAVYGVHVALAGALALTTAGAVVVAVRLPITATIVASLGLFATAIASAPATGLPWPVPATGIVAGVLVIAIIGLRHRWYLAVLAWAVISGASLAGALIGTGGTGGAMANFTTFAAIGLGIVVLVAVVRQLRSSRGEIEQVRALSAQEQRKRAELEERNRIAQELHDVVAHSLSVTSVQATTAKYRLPELAPEVVDEFDTIADSSRRALGEMRGLLRLLRGDGDADLAPQPTLADLPQLIESSRASGAEVDYVDGVGDGAAREIPATVALAAYRIVQEGISNALRHAHGARIRVEVRRASEAIEVDVVNGPADESRPMHPSPGAGLGLAGLRGRTEALGGTFAAAPEPENGFAVRARQPIA
jgi:signal transduction histidine kinase